MNPVVYKCFNKSARRDRSFASSHIMSKWTRDFQKCRDILARLTQSNHGATRKFDHLFKIERPPIIVIHSRRDIPHTRSPSEFFSNCISEFPNPIAQHRKISAFRCYPIWNIVGLKIDDRSREDCSASLCRPIKPRSDRTEIELTR